MTARTPIHPEDIKVGDLIRAEHKKFDGCAREWREGSVGSNPRYEELWDFFLLDRPTPPVDLPTEERVCYSDECAEPCQSYTAGLRGEIADLKRQNATIGDRLGEARRTIEAFISESSIRKQIEVHRRWEAEGGDAVVVPAGAVDRLRRVREGAFDLPSDSKKERLAMRDDAIRELLAAVDRANGADQ